MTASATPAADPAAPAQPAANGNDNWFTALPPDLGHVAKANGWYKDGASPVDVLSGALKGYGEIQKVVGLDKIALPPKGADGNRDWSKWDGWNTLGRPEKPEGYEFKPPEGREWSAEEKAMHAKLQAAMHGAGLTTEQFAKLGGTLAELGAEHEKGIAAAIAAAGEAMKQKWGAAFEQNSEIAARALNKASPALQAKIEKAGLRGDPEFYDLLLALGAGVQEDGTVNAIAASGGGRPGILTPAMARAERLKIMGDASTDPKHPYFNPDHPEHQAINARVMELIQLEQAGKA